MEPTIFQRTMPSHYKKYRLLHSEKGILISRTENADGCIKNIYLNPDKLIPCNIVLSANLAGTVQKVQH